MNLTASVSTAHYKRNTLRTVTAEQCQAAQLSTPGTPTISLTQTSVLGRQYSVDTRYLDSLLDEFRISKIARSDAEIQAIYNAGNPVVSPTDENVTYKLDFDNTLDAYGLYLPADWSISNPAGNTNHVNITTTVKTMITIFPV